MFLSIIIHKRYLYALFLWLFTFYVPCFNGTALADKDSQTFFEEAETLFNAGDPHSALEEYKEILSTDPSFVKAYPGIIQCYNSLGDPQGALKFMESLFLEYPEKGEISYGLGYSLYNLQRYDEALTSFKKAIELNQNIAAAWNNCGAIYHFINKDYRKARYYYEKALEISKKSGDDWVLKKAGENMSNLPELVELKPITEKMTLEAFINRFISHAENNNYKEIRELVMGQKENSRKAMEWFIGEAAGSFAEGRLEDEKTLILLSDILQDEYSISFRSSYPNDLLRKYNKLSGNEKKKIVEGETLLKTGAAKEQDGKYLEAGIDYQEALSCFASIEDKGRQGLAFLYLGDVNRKLKDFSLACDMYNRGISFFIETGEMERRAYALSSLGETCYMMGKYPEGIDYMNQSLEIYNLLEDREAVTRVQSNLELMKTRRQ